MSIYDKLGAKTAGIKARTVERVADKSPRTAPAMFLDAAQRMDAAEQKVEELEAKLRAAEAQMTSFELPLNQLREVPGRRRQLSDDEFAELRKNLKQNELVTPIVVRRLAKGGYEVVSGNNRVAVYRELERATIPAVVRETEAEQADLHAFYANLLQPNLPDYEKYLGFRMIQRQRPGLSHEQIADMAGVSRSQITKLMAFAGLPEAAHDRLRVHVHALGANAAQELAQLARQGREEQVMEAIVKLIAGEVDQAQAVKFASPPVERPRSSKSDPTMIKVGKAIYCAMRRADKVLRLEFKSAEEAQAIESAIAEVLRSRAEHLKSEKN